MRECRHAPKVKGRLPNLKSAGCFQLEDSETPLHKELARITGAQWEWVGYEMKDSGVKPEKRAETSRIGAPRVATEESYEAYSAEFGSTWNCSNFWQMPVLSIP